MTKNVRFYGAKRCRDRGQSSYPIITQVSKSRNVRHKWNIIGFCCGFLPQIFIFFQEKESFAVKLGVAAHPKKLLSFAAQQRRIGLRDKLVSILQSCPLAARMDIFHRDSMFRPTLFDGFLERREEMICHHKEMKSHITRAAP